MLPISFATLPLSHRRDSEYQVVKTKCGHYRAMAGMARLKPCDLVGRVRRASVVKSAIPEDGNDRWADSPLVFASGFSFWL